MHFESITWFVSLFKATKYKGWIQNGANLKQVSKYLPTSAYRIVWAVFKVCSCVIVSLSRRWGVCKARHSCPNNDRYCQTSFIPVTPLHCQTSVLNKYLWIKINFTCRILLTNKMRNHLSLTKDIFPLCQDKWSHCLDAAGLLPIFHFSLLNWTKPPTQFPISEGKVRRFLWSAIKIHKAAKLLLHKSFF